MANTNNDIKIIISNNIKFLLQRDHKSRKTVCNDLNIKYTSFCDWINGRVVPKYKNLEQLGAYFNVNVNDFFVDMTNRTDTAKRLLAYTEGLTNPNKELNMTILPDMSDEQIKELLNAGFTFKHKSYEERLSECNGIAQPYKFDWGEPKGREMF